jgi:hypothetical protein
MSKLFDNEQWMLEKVLEYVPGKYRRTSKDISWNCHICGDSKKSKNKMRFHYYIHTQSGYCFNCEYSCSGIQLLKDLSGKDFNELKKEYIKENFRGGGYTQSSTLSPSLSTIIKGEYFKSIIPEKWKNELTKDAYTYLKKRKIFDAPFLYDQKFYSCHDKTDNEYILIPWEINRVDAYYQINDYKRHGERKYVFPYNKTKLIYGLDHIDRAFPYIICFEGVYDSIFVKNGIALGGKTITNYQRVLLKTLFPQHKVVMALDNDEAGKFAALKQIDIDSSTLFFNWAKKYPNFKDINELIINKNKHNLFVDDNEIESLICGSLNTKLILTEFTL